MPEKEFHIPEVTIIDKIFDKAMAPIMWMLGGFKDDSVQETHAWHVHLIHPDMIDPDMAVEVHGDDNAMGERKNAFDFLFHAPIFGGWKRYSVVGHEELPEDQHWHIGWHVIHEDTKETKYSQINKLKLKNNKVKMLRGTPGYITRWFAFTHDGKQIKLNHYDEGIHGDKKHKKLRLL